MLGMETTEQVDMVMVDTHGGKGDFKAFFNFPGNFLNFLGNRLAQENLSVFDWTDDVVMGLVDAMMASLQCHAYSIFENLSVFKLSLSRYPAASRREIKCIIQSNKSGFRKRIIVGIFLQMIFKIIKGFL